MSVLRLALGTAAALALLTGCPPSTFTPNEVDAGTGADGVSIADIGRACTYDPAVGDNPTNQCAAGTECVIVTRDGRFNPLGMDLSFWEDQVTVAKENNVDVGYCSMIGNVNQQPQCPAGSIVKLVRSPGASGGFAAFCVATCNSSAECDGGRVCDFRYLDDGTGGNLGFCVSRCVSDLNHCVRSGVFAINNNNTLELLTAMFEPDLAGASVCNEDTGVCELSTHTAAGTDGARCSSTRDCAEGLTCYQKQIFANPPEFGFCAKRCTIVNDAAARPEQGSCDEGEVCQPGLAFGYGPVEGNNGVVVTSDGANFGTREGICLEACSDVGVTECLDGATCGATEATVMGQAWNGFDVCAPPAIREQG